MSQSLEWKWTCMELTHGNHADARRLAVVDGPEVMRNALVYHLPKHIPDQIGDLISRCHTQQFGRGRR